MKKIFSYQIIKQCLALFVLMGGAIITIATSPAPEPGWEPGPTSLEVNIPTISGSLFLAHPISDEEAWSNLSDEELVEVINERNRNFDERFEIMVSQIKGNIILNCEEIMKDPQSYLKTEMFSDPVIYSISRGDILEIEVEYRNECSFLQLIGSGLTPHLVTLDFNHQNRKNTNANGIGISEVPADTLILRDQTLSISSNSMFLSALTSWSQIDQGDWDFCPADYQSQLEWQLPTNFEEINQLMNIQRGVDGCHELKFFNDDSMLLCVPWEALDMLDRSWWIKIDESLMTPSKTLTISLYESENAYFLRKPSFILEGFKDFVTNLSFRYPLEQVTECEPLETECYTSLRLQVKKSAIPELDVDSGRPPLQLPDLENGKRHWLLTAEDRVLITQSCENNVPLAHYYLENFVVTDLRGEE